MSESLIRAQIKVIMETVSGIGVVHNRERFSRSLAEFLKDMSKSGTVNGWTIHRESTSSERLVSRQIDRKHTFKIRGIYALDDAGDSESTFQGILENIHSKFKANWNLNGTCKMAATINVDMVETEELANTVYHIAELTLVVEERETI